MEVNLKSTGWYNKLQEWTLGEMKPELFSLCPYFWLTIFCILIIPFTLIVKSVKYVYKKIKTKMINSYINSLDLMDIYFMKNLYEFKTKPMFSFGKNYYDYYDIWYDKMLASGKTKDEITAIVDAMREEYNKLYKQEQERTNKETEKSLEYRAKQQARKEKLKLWWVPVVKWTRRLVNFAITIIIMFFVTFIINGILINFNSSVFLQSLWDAIIISSIIVGLVLIVYLIYKIVVWAIENDKFAFITNMLIPVGQFFKYIGVNIGSIFKIFIEYFKANKNDYCPAINWDVDNSEKEK